MDESTVSRLNDYVTGLFAPEDDALRWIQSEAARHELPAISVKPHEGRLLQFLVWAVNARAAVEIGTLAGYSAVWMARALPPDGRLYTLEKSGKHAAVARASFARAGVGDRIEVLEGDARESMRKLRARAPFDFVFIDADKASYADYLAWALDVLRPGGMVAAHNAFRGGKVLNPETDDDRAMQAFNRALADDPRLHSTILAIGDGMAVGVKRA